MANLKIKLSMDEEVVSDFRESFNDQYELAASRVLLLESDPNNSDAINEIFRALHTIKGNASMCQLESVTKLAHTAEEVFVAIREGTLKFDPMMGEVALLILDKIKETSEDIFHGQNVDGTLLEKVQHELQDIKNNPDDELKAKAANLISLLSGHNVDENYSGNFTVAQFPSIKKVENIDVSDNNKKQQLDYFKRLALLLEKKHSNWEDRINRTLSLVLDVNEKMGSPEQPIQLQAAVYLHDWAHAFLDDIYLANKGKLTKEQLSEMRKHPEIAADLLELIPGWEDARQMILQHHEQWDGSGYPNGIDGESIRPGAQILAVIDAFESMTHARSDRKHKRSILRAMTEINYHSGTQFSPHVTAIFNSVIRDLLTNSPD